MVSGSSIVFPASRLQTSFILSFLFLIAINGRGLKLEDRVIVKT